MELYNQFKENGIITRKDKIAYEVHRDDSTFEQVENRISTEVSLEEWRNFRSELTTGEWINLLLRSIGYNPSGLLFYEKLIILMRLIPFIQKSFHMVELGPPGTGKSFIYTGLTSESYVKTDAITVPQLLGPLKPKEGESMGLINDFKVVVLDEIAEKTSVDGDAVTVLRDFMSNKNSGRSDSDLTSDASLVMLANLKEGQKEFYNDHSKKGIDLFEYFPKSMNNDPFKDRIALAIPGWKVRQNNPDCFPVDSRDAININSLFDLIFKLRDIPLDIPPIKVNGQGSRGKKSIEKTIRGLLKLLHLGKIENKDFLAIQELAVYGRQLVTLPHSKLNLKGNVGAFAIEMALTNFEDKSNDDIDKTYIDEDRIYIKFANEDILYKIPLSEKGIKLNKNEVSMYKKVRKEAPSLLKYIVHLESAKEELLKDVVIQDFVPPISDGRLLEFDQSVSFKIVDALSNKVSKQLFIQQQEEIVALKNKVSSLEENVENLKEILEVQINNMKKDMLELKAWSDLGITHAHVEEKSGFISLTKKSKRPPASSLEPIKNSLNLRKLPSSSDYHIDEKGNILLINFGHLL